MSTLLEPAEEIRGLEALPPDALYEVVDGEVKEIPPMGFAANQVAFRLATAIDDAVQNPRDIVAIESLFSLPLLERRRRRPDVAYVSADRVPDNWPPPHDEDPPAMEAAPTVAVEVVSPTDLMMELEEKRREYFASGVKAVLVVYPRFRTVHVYESPLACRILSESDTLRLPEILPGFSVRVADLFAPLNRPS